MKLKTYVARNLNEALAQVKKDLGSEAVILSTQTRRTFSPGSVWPCSEVEVKAAMDEPEAAGTVGISQKAYSNRLFLLDQVRYELKELKELFARWLKDQGPPAWLSAHRELADFYQMLVQKGVANQILQRWLAQVQVLMAWPNQHPPAGTDCALRLLMDSFEVVNPWQQLEKKEPRLWTFVGPAGVGKTTTIAKLAVQFALKMKKKVGLVSLDNIRWGAHDQLALYGKLIGAPFVPVTGRQGFLEALSRLNGLEVVLIDTPGQSPSSPDGVNLSEFFGETSALEHHLLLSATRSESNLAAAIQALSRFPLKSLVITKVDESQDFSGLFNQLCRHRVPVSYLTTGPRIPEDIEAASRQRIVALLLNNRQATDPAAASWDGYEQAVGAC